MVLVSYSGREINAKIVYYGPGLSGKTTNLEYIYGAIPQTHRGKMVSMKTKTERTLFFDFLPIHLGELSGFKTRFLLYTVPGQVYYNATRKLVLKGVDAVVFVADSKRGKMDENLESLENLRANLKEHGLSLEQIPWVIQYNKRDLGDVYPIEELERALNPSKVPAFEAVATTGQGVFETFKTIARMLLKHLSQEIGVRVVPAADETAAAGASAPANGGGAQFLLDPADMAQPPAATPSPQPTQPPQPAPAAQPPVWAVAPPVREEPIAPPPVPVAPPSREPVSFTLSAAPSPPQVQQPPMPAAPPPREVVVRQAPTPPARTEPAAPTYGNIRPTEAITPAAGLPAPFDAGRSPGVGDRLRRWFARPKDFEETPLTPERPIAAERKAPTTPPEPKRPVELRPPAPQPAPMPSVPAPMFEAPALEVVPSERNDRIREVPIFVDLDREDLESGVVLKLRICFRKTGEPEREDASRLQRARAA